MKTMTTSRRTLVALLLAALLLTGLTFPTGDATHARQATTLRVGYLGAPNSDAANGARLAIDQMNSLGGFPAPDGSTYLLELITLAEAPTADSLATSATALTAQNVVAVLGPDSDAVMTPDNIAALVNTGLPVFTGATGDTLTDDDAANVLLRLRAPESVYTNALASVLIDDLGLTSIALVHTDAASTQALLTFVQALDARGISAAAKVQLTEASGLLQETQNLVDLNPEAIVLWGPHEDAASMLSVLRKRGWQGTFAYRHADEAARAGVLSAALADGVIGVTSWSYAYPGETSRVFLDDYIKAFGEVPGPLAAAAYDALWYLRASIRSVGTDSAALRSDLALGVPLTLVGGELRPADYGNGDLIHIAMVYRLGFGGGPTVIAHFRDDTRLAIEGISG